MVLENGRLAGNPATAGLASLVLAVTALLAPTRCTLAASLDPRTLALDAELLEVAVARGTQDEVPVLLCFAVEDRRDRPRRVILQYALPGLSPGPRIAVPRDAVLFDVADVLPGPGEEIVFLEPDGVSALGRGEAWFGEEAKTLLSARTFFDHPEPDALFRHAFSLDLSGDGKADLLVPRHQGYLAAFRDGDGFGRLFSLDVAARNRMIRLTHEVFQLHFAAQRFSMPALRAADFDGDGRLDLLGLAGRDFVAFLGKGKEGFDLKPSFRMPLPFLESDVDEPEEDLFEGKRVFLEEVNGDGRVDLVAVRTQGKVGLFSSIRTRVELFLGRKDAFYPDFPDRLLTVPGVATRLRFPDLDGDGLADLVVPAVRTDILSGIKTAAVKEVTVTYTIFPCGSGGLWERSPGFSESVEVPVAGLEKGAAVPVAAFGGDFDGDGRRDRLVFEKGELRIHRGIPGTRFRFSEEPFRQVKAEVSNDFRVEDLDGDGLSDLLFFHADKVTVVLSRP